MALSLVLLRKVLGSLCCYMLDEIFIGQHLGIGLLHSIDEGDVVISLNVKFDSATYYYSEEATRRKPIRWGW